MTPLLFAPVAAAADWFTDIAGEASGIDFVHFNGMSGRYYFPEMMGGGAALFDYDADGDLDLYLVQGAMLGPDLGVADATFPLPAHGPGGRLYRNDGNLDFTDVTTAAGLDAQGYGMGVAVGDVDNDGAPDLYLTNFGSNQLLRNNGDGTFSDVTAAAGADDERWSVSAAFADYDGDGWLDLYVANYVQYSFTNAKTCKGSSGAPDYCSPQSYRPAGDRLLRNRGDGTFENVTVKAGVASADGPGLGVVARDFNNDGRLDFYVANDGAANYLWINDGQGRFSEQAMLSGVAVNMAGLPEASMGVAAADIDDDGDQDLFMTHLDRQSNTLYVNQGTGWFMDRTAATRLAADSLPYTGFGTAWLDFDLDGRLDLVSANGAVVVIEEQRDRGEVYPLRQRNQLWRGTGPYEYVEVTAEAGTAFAASAVSRGIAVGDLDNDGDPDLVVHNSAAAPQVLINQQPGRPWVGADVRRAGRQAIGASVTLVDGVGQRRTRVVARDGSYASANDPRVVFAVTGLTEPLALEIRLPGAPAVRRVDVVAQGEYQKIELTE